MNAFLKKLIFTGIVIAGLAAGLSWASVVPTALALTVSPVKLEMAGKPGQGMIGEMDLLNEQSETKTFYSSFENFETSGESGAPSFIGGETGFATWFATDPQVTLEPGERKKIPFTITIPANAEPGGHFAAIFWGTQPPSADGGGQVAIGGKVGILMLLRVAGDIKEGGGLLDFGAKDQQSFFTSLPVNLAWRFNNTGGDRVLPQGEIQIKNQFGSAAAILPANGKAGNVLPGSIRKFTVTWGEDSSSQSEEVTGVWRFLATIAQQWREFHVGWYTANLSVTWGTSSQSAAAIYGFWVIPWQLLLIMILVLLVAGWLLVVLLKKYNRWIISLALQQYSGRSKKRK